MSSSASHVDVDVLQAANGTLWDRFTLRGGNTAIILPGAHVFVLGKNGDNLGTYFANFVLRSSHNVLNLLVVWKESHVLVSTGVRPGQAYGRSTFVVPEPGSSHGHSLAQVLAQTLQHVHHWAAGDASPGTVLVISREGGPYFIYYFEHPILFSSPSFSAGR